MSSIISGGKAGGSLIPVVTAVAVVGVSTWALWLLRLFCSSPMHAF